MDIQDLNDLIHDTRQAVSDYLEDGAPQINDSHFRELEGLEKALFNYRRYVR